MCIIHSVDFAPISYLTLSSAKWRGGVNIGERGFKPKSTYSLKDLQMLFVVLFPGWFINSD